jgi:tungstate transport system substrate-binding protein
MLRVILFVLSTLAIGVAHADERYITLASTTSTQDSGLFGYILPFFKTATGIDVHVVAVGTGQALTIGERGDADVLLVHDRPGEDKFVAEGYGIDRRDVMYNDFVIVGPNTDPALIRGLKDARKALTQIADAKAPFASRGDDSGTNRMELRLWKSAGIQPDPHSGWYRDLGQGMGPTLNIAAGMNAYTLTDRATWANFKNRQNLEILTEGDPALFNPYGCILVNPAKWPKVKYEDAKIWHDWLTTKSGRRGFLSAAALSHTLAVFQRPSEIKTGGAYPHRQHDQDHTERKRET